MKAYYTYTLIFQMYTILTLHQNSTLEEVQVNHWQRGKEKLFITEPIEKEIQVIGLGGRYMLFLLQLHWWSHFQFCSNSFLSVSTPLGGLDSDAIVVDSFDELHLRKNDVRGKIVIFNAEWNQSYSNSVTYRARGAIEASKYGAVASLIRSVTPRSLYTVHTGSMQYDDEVPKIPGGAITIEDATYLRRMQDRGEPIRLHLTLESEFFSNVTSYNVIGEIQGSEYPDEIVVIGGHIDSWDVGQGTQDDGVGCIMAWEAVRLIHALNLKPKRTIRVVLWTNEENGMAGAHTYYESVYHN